MDYMGRSMKSQMKSAGNFAEYAANRPHELDKNILTFKDLKDGTQEELSLDRYQQTKIILKRCR